MRHPRNSTAPGDAFAEHLRAHQSRWCLLTRTEHTVRCRFVASTSIVNFMSGPFPNSTMMYSSGTRSNPSMSWVSARGPHQRQDRRLLGTRRRHHRQRPRSSQLAARFRLPRTEFPRRSGGRQFGVTSGDAPDLSSLVVADRRRTGPSCAGHHLPDGHSAQPPELHPRPRRARQTRTPLQEARRRLALPKWVVAFAAGWNEVSASSSETPITLNAARSDGYGARCHGKTVRALQGGSGPPGVHLHIRH